MKTQSVLCVIAHPDDLEMMAGGSVARWIQEGAKVHVLTLTDGVWRSPGGELMRTSEAALAEEQAAASTLGYTVENLQLQALHLDFQDSHVVEVLNRIAACQPDTLVLPWAGDVHHDHAIVSRIGISASRRVPRVLMGQINYYLNDFFKPNVFVDITQTWEQKVEALKCFEGEWSRAGEDWYEYMDITSRYYGKMVGVKRAEGFMCNKYLL
jgi:LmbE family N-acetylglucosaminyl deacetylase